jgi:hypothetical protein
VANAARPLERALAHEDAAIALALAGRDEQAHLHAGLQSRDMSSFRPAGN